jgi:hypothetical protein
LVYGRSVKLVPRDRLVLESELAPAEILAAIPRAVEEWNRRAVLFRLRSRVDADEVRVGWWPPLALAGAGVTFDGHVSRHGARVVVAGEVGLFPRWYDRVLGGLLLLALAVPLVQGFRDDQASMGALGAAWLFGGGRLGMEILFRTYQRRIARVLRRACGHGEGGV